MKRSPPALEALPPLPKGPSVGEERLSAVAAAAARASSMAQAEAQEWQHGTPAAALVRPATILGLLAFWAQGWVGSVVLYSLVSHGQIVGRAESW